MKYLLGAALAVALSTGCAGDKPTIWDKPDYTPELFAKESYACGIDAINAGPMRTEPNMFYGSTTRRQFDKEVYAVCMNSKGYTARSS